MAKLIYTTITSLDGYIEDREGSFDWSTPDDEVHSCINNLERSIGTYLLGRKLYEVMKVWDQFYGQPDHAHVVRDYANIWHMVQKVVFSTTLDQTDAAKTRIERTFDPDAIRRLKAESREDLSVGGANLAGQALKAGLVDEIHLFVSPVIVGGGKRALPGNLATRLELAGQRHFGNGVVHLHYRVNGS